LLFAYRAMSLLTPSSTDRNSMDPSGDGMYLGSFLQPNLGAVIQGIFAVCHPRSKGSFYHANGILRGALQMHTDTVLTFIGSTPIAVQLYLGLLLPYLEEPAAVSMLLDCLCLPPRTAESTALNLAQPDDGYGMDSDDMSGGLMAGYQCASSVKLRHYRSISEAMILEKLAIRACSEEGGQSCAQVAADCLLQTLRHFSGDPDGAVAVQSLVARLDVIVERLVAAIVCPRRSVCPSPAGAESCQSLPSPLPTGAAVTAGGTANRKFAGLRCPGLESPRCSTRQIIPPATAGATQRLRAAGYVGRVLNMHRL